MGTQDIFNVVLAFDEETVKAKTQAELDGGADISAIRANPAMTLGSERSNRQWLFTHIE